MMRKSGGLTKRIIDGKRSVAANYGVSFVITLLLVVCAYRFGTAAHGLLDVAIIAAAIISALIGGIGPGILTSVISVLGLDYFVIGPGELFESGIAYVDFAFSLLVVILISVMVGSLRSHYVGERAANDAKERVIGIVSHDLRNPLTGIQMYAELLLSEKAKNPVEAIRGILRSVEQMQKIIRDLLDANRIAAGKFSIEKHPESVKSLVDQAIGMLRASAESRGVSFSVEISNDKLILSSDRGRMVQALANIIQNAIKFSPSGGMISVSVLETEDVVTFKITDQGRGIAPEDFPHLFEQYWTRAEGNIGGTGLGLFVVKGIAQSHGGDVSAENNRSGPGAVFSLRIPKTITSKA